MSIFKCKMCGGTIEFEQGASVGVCDSCGTKQTLPRLDDDKKANLYDRANHFRRNNDFDKAMSIYEQILNEDSTDAEAYWSLVLCRYGIEYVEDPATHKRIPTVNRAQFTSVYMDEDYKSALQYADGYQKTIYEAEAKAIDDIQKGILEISSKEEPFDVFICYKETDAGGRRTQDSVLANDLYHQLTQEGFKVFFSRITLEDKLGTAYEPYIFAALNSAKVMVVLGTKPEYFNAVWVKNEWSRYLALIKNGAKKMLIPAYRDMDPYDLPEEFSHLQAQDMSKLGFINDLVRGIKKVIGITGATEMSRRTENSEDRASINTDSLLKRAFMFLEDEDWESANTYCEKILDNEPECAQAYLGKLMSDLHVKKLEDLENYPDPFENDRNYQKAIRFGDEKLVAFLNKTVSQIKYNKAIEILNTSRDENDCMHALSMFKDIRPLKNSNEKVTECAKKAKFFIDEKIKSNIQLAELMKKRIDETCEITRENGERIERLNSEISKVKKESNGNNENTWKFWVTIIPLSYVLSIIISIVADGRLSFGGVIGGGSFFLCIFAVLFCFYKKSNSKINAKRKLNLEKLESQNRNEVNHNKMNRDKLEKYREQLKETEDETEMLRRICKQLTEEDYSFLDHYNYSVDKRKNNIDSVYTYDYDDKLEYYDIQCPVCNEKISVDSKIVKIDKKMNCPYCNELLEFEW